MQRTILKAINVFYCKVMILVISLRVSGNVNLGTLDSIAQTHARREPSVADVWADVLVKTMLNAIT